MKVTLCSREPLSPRQAPGIALACSQVPPPAGPVGEQSVHWEGCSCPSPSPCRPHHICLGSQRRPAQRAWAELDFPSEMASPVSCSV